MSDSEHKVLLDLEKNARERLRVSVSDFKGTAYVHVRNWYANREGEPHQPGKGIALRSEHLPKVIEALQAAAKGVP